MSEAQWAAPGVECICIKQANDLTLIFNALADKPTPTFMQIYKIDEVAYAPFENEGHRVKLVLVEIPGYIYCACGFQPLEKLKDEDETTTKVDDRLTTKRPSTVS